jgi:hypothetical protein
LFAVSIGQAKADVCGVGGNPIACENSLTGTPSNAWDVNSGEGGTIAGFADPFSVNLGGTVNLKIQSPATSYHIDIYRMGYYGGAGARLITSLTPNISVTQHQSTCHTNTATGLVDCSDWGVSASWTVPSTMVSGVYFAHIQRTDPSGGSDENQIPFVVRNDLSHSGILFKTDDATWEAYNDWGGYSLYAGNASDTMPPSRPTNLDPGRAEQVSYDRPFKTRFDTPFGQDYFFYAEFPMIQFLERNGYDMSYIDQGTLASAQGASLIEQHKTLVAAGHDEYWSGPEVASVTAARDAGVNLAFFTGNEAFWKTRWAADAAGEAGRTLITYKESLDSAITDPQGPSMWTGQWDDPRFSPPGDGGKPQNGLTGQLWTVNQGTSALQVPARFASLRFWRNTSVASLQPGQTAALPNETLGYEWDQDVDNGYRPAGQIDLSSTTMTAPEVLSDYQEDVVQKTLTHNLTQYRASSGALVFEAGTVQWVWGLSANHDGDQPAASPIMQQATVNLLADMGNLQPATLMPGLVAATQSADAVAPTSSITSPAASASIANGNTVTISGSATDSGGGAVAGVEVSADGGTTWHPATTMSAPATSVTWGYTWSATGLGNVTLKSRATDDSGNIEKPGSGITVSVHCPCGLYGQSYTPAITSDSDSAALELGVKFTPSVNGYVTGVRFYKGTGNTGPHTGSLWSASGTQLATGTFANETASGWQKLTFASSVAVTANTTYIASYYTPTGHYAFDAQQFYPAVTASAALPPLDSAPLAAARANVNSGNGLFNPGGSGFPTNTYNGSGYGVDVIFSDTAPAGPPPTVSSTSPSSGATGVSVSTAITATFSQAISPGTATVSVTGSDNSSVAGAMSLGSGGTVVTFTPSNSLANGTTYTVTVSNAVDTTGVPMSDPVTWQFTTAASSGSLNSCPCTLFPSGATPGTTASGDSSAVTLGVQFTSDTNGWITGVRFYKGGGNTGTHIGNLWSASGTLLAQGVFSNETASGWQTLSFSSAVQVTAGTTYVAGYYAPNGHYAVDGGYFTSAVDNSPLHAPASGGTIGNGLYSYGNDQFPVNSFNGTNYWVDPIFSDQAPTQGGVQCPCTIWPASAQPAFASANDSGSVNVGVKFTTSANGFIKGIRFYKGPSNTGTHIGSLWSAGGSLLGQVTFTGESASGWQEADFASPIAVTAGTTYLASYLAPNGGYSVDSGGLASAIVDGPLTALASGTSSGNGVYTYSTSSQFPTSTFNASNYWVDVAFTQTAS